LRVVVEFRGQEREIVLADGTVISDAARAIGVSVESAVFLLDGAPSPSDEPLRDGARVKVISAISGG
jgi:sulfur carrier protein ThiS